MMAAGGPVGFFLLWSLFVTGMFLAVRSHRMATTPLERMAAVGAACALLLFLVQAWGDMGTQNWSTTWLVSAALAVAGKISISTGAWPSRLRLQTIRGLRPVFALEA
jgi:protein-S-isoprenylcysteine O-methyltransferase Ste14